ncbi:MAG TPA: transposase [Acidobacteriota bacterium]|nr:transposase [Acidobacteriota bacterium]
MRPQIPAAVFLRVLLVARLLREVSFLGAEELVRSPARQTIGVRMTFGDDALVYFTERLSPDRLRETTVGVVKKAKRNKAFQWSRWIGLAFDGSGMGRSKDQRCEKCRPVRNKEKEITGYHHKTVMVSVGGTGLSLPLDAEPYGPGDSEYAAGQRLLHRTVKNLGVRFADYAVVDGEFATAPFLHAAGDEGLRVVARLKDNLPELSEAAQRRFVSKPPDQKFRAGDDRVEIWDADDFDPWDTLRWETVRVIRYRQYKPDGTVVEAYWLTDWLKSDVGSRDLYHMAKSRWEIENQGFNDGKNRYGLEHICHHHPNSLLINWLLIALTLTLERLYRNRYLHRGSHTTLEAVTLVRLLWMSLGRRINSS